MQKSEIDCKKGESESEKVNWVPKSEMSASRKKEIEYKTVTNKMIDSSYFGAQTNKMADKIYISAD